MLLVLRWGPGLKLEAVTTAVQGTETIGPGPRPPPSDPVGVDEGDSLGKRGDSDSHAELGPYMSGSLRSLRDEAVSVSSRSTEKGDTKGQKKKV
ncbi:hypothetical protein BaRGS_00006120 [Batillaria attramentaria]|uniref:Uncharacterized protein n=1 Tax=Batillaria attramentaria TaxID=370345 RepID=A0ABD0LTC5_9CAEN